jgi:hypothetical protein
MHVADSDRLSTEAERERMHDLDRTQLEHSQEFESASEAALGHAIGEFEHTSGESEAATELELAAHLLEIHSEEELEQFLGDVLSGAVQGARALAATPTGQALTGILKDAAKQALPVVGGAIGKAISPGSGQAWGERAGRAAGDLLGLELEGLSHEDREFEVAKRVVQMGRESWGNLAKSHAAGHVPASTARPAGMHPATAATHPAGVAARAHANGLTPTQLRGRESAIAHHAAAEAAKRFMPGLHGTLAAKAHAAGAAASQHPAYHPGGAAAAHRPGTASHHFATGAAPQLARAAGPRVTHAGPHVTHAGPYPAHAGPHPAHPGPHPLYAGPRPAHAGPRPAHAGPHPAHLGPHPARVQPGIAGPATASQQFAAPGGAYHRHRRHRRHHHIGPASQVFATTGVAPAATNGHAPATGPAATWAWTGVPGFGVPTSGPSAQYATGGTAPSAATTGGPAFSWGAPGQYLPIEGRWRRQGRY